MICKKKKKYAVLITKPTNISKSGRLFVKSGTLTQTTVTACSAAKAKEKVDLKSKYVALKARVIPKGHKLEFTVGKRKKIVRMRR